MFWFIVALLCVVAVTFVVFPLLRQVSNVGPEHGALNAAVLSSQRNELEQDLADGVIDEEQFRQAQDELARESREVRHHTRADRRPRRSTWTAAALAIAVPVMASAVYQQVGSGSAPVPQTSAAMGLNAGDFTEMIARLQQRLQNNPDDPAGWAMLARSLYSIGQPEQALHAFRRAIDSGVETPGLYAQYADLLANEQRGFTGEPDRLIRKALRLDPDNEHALWLAASSAQESGKMTTALDYWERLYAVLDPSSENAAIVAENLRAVRAQLDTGR